MATTLRIYNLCSTLEVSTGPRIVDLETRASDDRTYRRCVRDVVELRDPLHRQCVSASFGMPLLPIGHRPVVQPLPGAGALYPTPNRLLVVDVELIHPVLKPMCPSC